MNKSLIVLLSCLLVVLSLSGYSQPTGQKLSGEPELMKDYGLKKYILTSRRLPHSEKSSWKLICKLPYNCQFQPCIEVNSQGKDTIIVSSTNSLVINKVKPEGIITKTGKQFYEAQNWISGEGVVYTIPAGVKVISVKYHETGFNTCFAGSFECNDNDYNILWKKAVRTAYICMRDHFYDCPDRERIEFWGDGTPELGECFYAFDSHTHILCKNLVLKPLQKNFYPGQQLEFLGEYGLWFYYMQTGDLNSIRTVYDRTRDFLLHDYQLGNAGQWFDWGKNLKDIAIIEKCFMYADLNTLKKMALLTGHADDIPSIDAKLNSIKEHFDHDYWNGRYYQSNQVPSPDDRANAMAVDAGLADSSKWQSIYDEVLSKKTYASSFFDRWVFEALCKMGKQEYALLRMAQRYKTMIPCSFTTLWEHYDRWWATGNDAFDPGSSLNHGWNPPILNLSQSIAGIAPEEAGWKVYHVLPREAFLNRIKAVVPSVKGKIFMNLKKTSSQYALRLKSPLHTTAIVGIPKNSFSKLEQINVNGKTVWNGQYKKSVAGISWDGEDAEYIKFYVAPGNWLFTGTGTLPLASPKTPPATIKEGVKLIKSHWIASSSVKDSFFVANNEVRMSTDAANAIDNDHWTGWRDMTQTQHAGQWFQIDMRKQQRFNRIVLDNTWALWDSPDKYVLTASKDGIKWDTVATGSGQLGITSISFPTLKARYIKITQTGSNPLYHWSIFELEVYR